MPTASPLFDDQFRARLRDLFAWRRDVRRFRADPLPAGTLERLIEAAVMAPSVGLSQPWRFVVVDQAARRAAILDAFRDANKDALTSYAGETAAHYATLKLAGLTEAPTHFAVFADRDTNVGQGLGRKTMPETIEYSVVMAVHTIWLLARAEGIGMGWVSIIDPARVAAILDVPAAWRFVGYFCLGYPARDDDTPELEREGWEKRRPVAGLIERR
ncbi:MAG TPA: 5,6-dimethylbenzimidazole synthase [Magnetospirillaceae bacterium]|jgi:5,6-dimethylbenzimidazole synthase